MGVKTWKRDTVWGSENTTWEKKNKVRMEVEPSLTLSNDLKRACELLERLQRSKYCGEVPATKLAALHKVLQSEFLNAVREVYEHIYETVEVDGSPDIRASATAKATVAAFAASEGHAHPRVVSRVWISSNYICQKLSCCNLQPTIRTSTRAVKRIPDVCTTRHPVNTIFINA